MLTTTQVEHYQTEGYVAVHDFLSAEEIAAFLREMDSVSAGQTLANHDAIRMEMEPNQPPDGTQIRRLYEPCSHYEVFRAFSESERLLDAVEALLGPDLVFHYSKINMKPAGVGSPVEWHQDLSYYPLTHRGSVSILFYFDSATVENGCLQAIPRRHQADLLSHNTDGFFQGRVTEAVDQSPSRADPRRSGHGHLHACDDPSCLHRQCLRQAAAHPDPQLPRRRCLPDLHRRDDVQDRG